MQYQVEHHPNPDALTIHVSTEVTHSSIDSYEGPDAIGPGWGHTEMPALVSDLFAVPGITKVSLSRYSIFLIKGKIFKWDEMLESIKPVLKNHLSPDDEMVEDSTIYAYSAPRAHSMDLDAMDDAFGLPEDDDLGDLGPADLVGTADTDGTDELGTAEETVDETATSETSEADLTEPTAEVTSEPEGGAAEGDKPEAAAPKKPTRRSRKKTPSAELLAES